MGDLKGMEPEAATYNHGMSSRQVHAVCTHDCPDSCGVLVTVEEATGRALKVQGDPSHPVTRGFLCGKVARYLDRVYSPERLLSPMRRRAGVAKGPLPKGQEAAAFERISWEEALTEIVARLQSVAAEYGPESVLPYSYAGTIGQLGYGSMDRRFFYRFGASQLDRTICASAGAEALTRVYGTRLGMEPQQFAEAGLILAWGANIHGNNIHLWPFIEQARRAGAKLVVIDPYRTRTAALADEHLAILPGTDVLLALAMMHVLFRDGLVDEAYLEECTEGWRELRAHALQPEHAPAAVAATTGLGAERIEALARTFGLAGRDGRKPAAIRMNYGIQRAEGGGTAARAVAMLPLLTGSWKQRGGGLLLSMSSAFGFNSAALQMPELGKRSPLGRLGRMVNMSQLGDALTTLNDPPVKAVFVYNCNAAAVAPDSTRVLQGLRREDLFTVVHEQFFTDTTDYADLVLPATTFLEHTDLMGSYGHRFAQLSQQAIAPLGEARSNVWLFSQLGLRMGFEPEFFAVEEEALIEQALVSPSRLLQGITKERLQREGHVPLAFEENALPFSTREWFGHASARAQMLPVPQWQAPVESIAHREAAFPLQFLPRKADNFMNTTFANLAGHQQMERKTAGVLEMHTEDAASRGIAQGDEVRVWNTRGSIRLLAKLGEQVGRGVVAARLDWQKLSADGANVNALTSQRLTDIGGGATFYTTLVDVAKVD
ncbi:MAG: molybdopterin-dependent oxidoreductase [Acidobacteriaceae bacterium]|nr:molybdopterin-dependent oxidoreductase [Acidobacteriaceae bacterium]